MNSGMSLRSSSLRGQSSLRGAPDDPMASMGNLMDVMLVFACALLIALVTHYNVQLSNQASQTDSTLEEVDGQLEGGQAEISDSSGLTAVGTLYQDPETGQLYVLSE